MILDRNIAEEIVNKSLASFKLLEEVVFLARDNCSPEERDKVKQGVGRSIGYMATFVLESIYKEHPDLRDYEVSDYKSPKGKKES